MACVALASLMATIEHEFLKPIPGIPLQDHQAQAQSLHKKISSLQAFLDEESSGPGSTALIKDLEIKIRDFALKVEDDMEIQLSNFLLAKGRKSPTRKASRELHKTLRIAAGNAAELMDLSHSLIKEAEYNENQPSIPWLKHGSSPDPLIKMVGRQRDRREIINQLTKGGLSNLKLLSIVGMVGIGKTTLAKSVYKDPIVQNHFEVCRWVTIPQEYNKTETLGLLLRSISSGPENKIEKEKHTTPEELAKQVRTQLRYKRYLIVLDNIQDIGAWNDIQTCFPNDSYGSSVLLTTGHFNLNLDCSFFYTHNHIHSLNLLDPSESWDLFCNVILSLKERVAPEFEQIKKHILEICDGLPWSIVVVAKRLSKCNNNILKEWEKIRKEIESLGILDRNALNLYYNQLPQHLKACFLYLGVFPKRKEIRVKKVIRLWITEGFVKPLEYDDFENQGYAYLKELIDRSLVLICNWSSDGNIKTCRMHSALHSFCVGESQKEGIFCAINTLQHPELPLSEFANSCRWLSLYTHSFDYYVLYSTNNPRSIFFFDDDPETFVPFKLLRVLAFVPSPFLQRVSMHLGHLVFLRYLSISERYDGLGDIVSLFSNLQTLIVSSNEPQIEAPTIHLAQKIWELPKLRHLELGDMYMVDPPSVVKRKLQTLCSVVDPTHCWKEVYFRCPYIKELKIFYKQELEEPNHNTTCESFGNPIILDDQYYRLQHLERLTISIRVVGRVVTLPEPCMFPSQLKKLTLSGTNLSPTNLKVIGMELPELRVLKLENALLERVWRVAKGEFNELRFLLLEDKRLEQLLVEHRSFPSLEHLVLRVCCCLQEISVDVFAECFTLDSIELDRCNPSLIASAKLIQKMPQLWRGSLKLKIDGTEYFEPDSYTHAGQSAEEDL
ncbi:PREDICTED: putative late blight resistance protein homolog R1B-17 [Ipomoea nil]|uniref:putative late blight resistance protein homolog R1B-17 n=1 Tax=Ipomoea nil TaxID=35883 RepID=UPI0009016BE1|nr:PREDICTED: putative late blight resistance protein homolog R1B-17 [Ipomoea nil]